MQIFFISARVIAQRFFGTSSCRSDTLAALRHLHSCVHTMVEESRTVAVTPRPTHLPQGRAAQYGHAWFAGFKATHPRFVYCELLHEPVENLDAATEPQRVPPHLAAEVVPETGTGGVLLAG